MLACERRRLGFGGAGQPGDAERLGWELGKSWEELGSEERAAREVGSNRGGQHAAFIHELGGATR